MNYFEAVFPLFQEMRQLAFETKTLLEGERGMENFKKELEKLINDFQLFLSETKEEKTPFSDEKIEQSIQDLKTVFENIVDFFSNTLKALNTNQRAIQAYSQRALESVFEG